MYWTFKQQLAHHTVNGCNMRTGDLLATGTISGPTKDSLGSLLEMSWNGTQPLTLDGSSRTFLEDGDELILKGYWSDGSKRIGFGSSSGVVYPAIQQMTIDEPREKRLKLSPADDNKDVVSPV